MKRILCSVAVVICSAVGSVYLQAQNQSDVVFDVTNLDAMWLNYYRVTNDFDSATVFVEYGELQRIDGAGARHRVLTSWNPLYSEWYKNADTVGLQRDIASRAQWDTVTLTPGSQLRFYRRAGVVTFGQRTPQNPHGRASAWDVTDSTWIVLEAYDVSTGERLLVLDSVRLDPCTKATFAGFSGTNAKKTFHSVTVPSAAFGKTIRVRAMPYRQGPTPYGMQFRSYRYEMSQSAVSLDSGRVIPKERYDSLLAVRFDQTLEFMDYFWRSYCFLPSFQNWDFTPEQISTVAERYFVVDTMIAGAPVYRVKPCTTCDSCPSIPKQKTHFTIDGIISGNHGITVDAVIYQPDAVVVDLTSSTQSYSVAVDVMDVVGRVVRSGGSHELRPGQRNSIRVEIDNVSKGRLFLRLVDSAKNMVLVIPLSK